MQTLPVVIALFTLSAYAQPRVGILDYYGQQKVSTERIAKALKLNEGDPLPPSKVDLEEVLEQIPDVVRSHIEAVCCVDGKAILYSGIEERGAAHFDYRLPSEGKEIPLPPADDLPGLIVAVRDAGEASVRADAAALLGDKPASQQTIDTLQFAAQDADPTVRRAAVRGLVRMARALPDTDPDQKLQVQPTWIIEMLNSVIWTDRVNAVEALLALTDTPDPVLTGKIRESGFDSLKQMAQWKHLPHALPPYLLLCRVAGIADAEAHGAWSNGERDRVIAQIVKARKK